MRLHARRAAAWIAVLSLLAVGGAAQAAEKRRIYIRPFAAQGLSDGDRLARLVRDQVSEYIVEQGDYALVSDDEVAQVLAREKTAALLGSADDPTVFARVAATLRCDTIVFGTVAEIGGKTTITLKLVDSAGKTVRLERVKTLSFQGRKRVRAASRDLAAYVLTGDEPPLYRYEPDEDAWLYGQMPTAVGLSWVRYGPTASTFERYYGGLNGVGAQALLGFRRYFAASAELSWATAHDRRTGNASVSLAALGLGLRAGLPVRDTFFPYLGVVGKGIRLDERGSSASASFTGWGLDGVAGLSVNPWRRLSVFAEYRRGTAKLRDAAGTDVSGATIAAGLMYGLR